MKKYIILLAWWFVAQSPNGISTVIGPFDTETQCENMSTTVYQYWGTHYSPCWEYRGKTEAERSDK